MVNLRKLNECIFNCRQAGDSVRNNQPFTKSAIMIIFSLDENRMQNDIILIKRKNNLRKHAGQIAFPGGRFENKDKNLKQTAFRETKEEINISKENLMVLGSLPTFYTGTGYAVKPFLSVLREGFDYKGHLKADKNEVDKILIINVKDLLTPSNQIRINAPKNSKMKKTWKVNFQNENIWGLTARVLVTISAGLNLREYPPCDDI